MPSFSTKRSRGVQLYRKKGFLDTSSSQHSLRLRPILHGSQWHHVRHCRCRHSRKNLLNQFEHILSAPKAQTPSCPTLAIRVHDSAPLGAKFPLYSNIFLTKWPETLGKGVRLIKTSLLEEREEGFTPRAHALHNGRVQSKVELMFVWFRKPTNEQNII